MGPATNRIIIIISSRANSGGRAKSKSEIMTKFKVELDGFYLDYEDELEPALKKYITRSVVESINKSIADKVEEAITKEVRAQVEKTLYREIQKLVANIISSEKIVKSRKGNGNELISVEEHIKERLSNTTAFSSPTEHIKQIAAEFGKELKNRYDVLYASQIVVKLGDNGLLKDDVIKMLLDTNKK